MFLCHWLSAARLSFMNLRFARPQSFGGDEGAATRTRVRRSFSLLELIVAVVVLSVLALVAIPTFRSVISNSETARVETELTSFARSTSAIRAFEPDPWSTVLPQVLPEMSSTPTWTLLGEGEPSTVYGELGWTTHGDGSVTLEMAVGNGDVAAVTVGGDGTSTVSSGDSPTTPTSPPPPCPEPGDTMRLVFDTSQTGTPEAWLPLRGAVDVTVDWGDGNTTVVTEPGDVTHTYATGGMYTVSIDGTLEQYGAWPGWPTPAGPQNLIGVESFGDLGLLSLADAFGGTTNVSSVPRCLPPTVLDLSGTFSSSTQFNDPNITFWDTSNVTDMSAMFGEAQIFDQPIGVWDVSNVTNMAYMLAWIPGFNQPLGDWDTTNVEDMSAMFFRAHDFDQPIGDWDVSNVTDMNHMFFHAYTFNQPIGDWDVSNVNNMNCMFYSYSSAVSQFNQPLHEWDVSNVADMSCMFYQADSFNQDLSSWCVSHIDDPPPSFDYGAGSWVLPRPSWGSCP